jgi:hypothetical protein
MFMTIGGSVGLKFTLDSFLAHPSVLRDSSRLSEHAQCQAYSQKKTAMKKIWKSLIREHFMARGHVRGLQTQHPEAKQFCNAFKCRTVPESVHLSNATVDESRITVKATSFEVA